MSDEEVTAMLSLHEAIAAAERRGAENLGAAADAVADLPIDAVLAKGEM